MRPKIKRHICPKQGATFNAFKPNGIPLSKLKKIVLQNDELEALRLVDIQNLAQQNAALHMQVSRQTFANILKVARKKVTSALINGDALVLASTDGEQQ